MRKWLRRKSTRLCLSLMSGLLAVGFTGNTADMGNTQKPHSIVAWWGLLYPDFQDSGGRMERGAGCGGYTA